MTQYRDSHNETRDVVLSQEDTEALTMMRLKSLAKAFVAGVGVDLDKLEKLANTKEQPTDRELLRNLLAEPYADTLRVFAGSFRKLGIYVHAQDDELETFRAAKVGLLALAREYPNRLDLILYAHNVGLLRPDAKHETWLYERGSFTFGFRWKQKKLNGTARNIF